MSGLRFPSKENIDIFKQDFSNQKATGIQSESSEFQFDPSVEPVLQNNPDRFVTLPIADNDIWLFYKKALTMFWVAEQVDLSKESESWSKLTKEERHFVSHVLILLVSGGGIATENIIGAFLRQVQSTEARYVFGFHVAVEHIHSEMYSLLIDACLKDCDHKLKLFHEMETLPYVCKKVDWVLRWADSCRVPYNVRIVAYAALQGIFFSGSLAALSWLQKRGLVPGICDSNELVSKDAVFYTEFACLMFRKLNVKPSEPTVVEIITGAVNIEKEFLTDTLPVALIGLDVAEMCKYIEYVADCLLTALGVSKIYNSDNPFDFMHLVSTLGKTILLESISGQYQAPGVMIKVDDRVFDLK